MASVKRKLVPQEGIPIIKCILGICEKTNDEAEPVGRISLIVNGPLEGTVGKEGAPGLKDRCVCVLELLGFDIAKIEGERQINALKLFEVRT